MPPLRVVRGPGGGETPALPPATPPCVYEWVDLKRGSGGGFSKTFSPVVRPGLFDLFGVIVGSRGWLNSFCCMFVASCCILLQTLLRNRCFVVLHSVYAHTPLRGVCNTCNRAPAPPWDLVDALRGGGGGLRGRTGSDGRDL